MAGPIRVVVAKPGLDGHDRGAKVVARALRDAGMEVIYTGLHQTPEQIVETAIQEDADGIGLSVLSGAHMTLFAKVLELLKERDAEDISVFGGGIIPEADIPELERPAWRKIFTPGATTHEIVDWVRGNVGEAAKEASPTPERPRVQAGGVGRVVWFAVRVRTTSADVQPSGATPAWAPRASTFSGNDPSVVRWPISQSSQPVAPVRSPADAAASANRPVSGVQATSAPYPWPGTTPPVGSRSRSPVFATAASTSGDGGANGGARNVTEESSRPPAIGERG